MEKVAGLGGVFVRARDRVALATWYRDHLGLDIDEQWWGAVLPVSEAGDPGGIWSAFAPDTDYFGARENAFMVNFRVRDVPAMIAQLREAGCDVDDKVESNDYGTFGWVTDPEGHRVELWHPPETPPPT